MPHDSSSELKLEKYSDAELIARFNRDVGNPGWGASRSRWGSEVSDEVHRRGWIYPEEWLAGGVSYGRRVVLVGNTVNLRSLRMLNNRHPKEFSYFCFIPSPRFDSLALQGGVCLIQTVL